MKDRHNNRQRLALHLLDWHGGQGSGLYAVGSTWLVNKPVSKGSLDKARLEIESLISRRVHAPSEVMKEARRENSELRTLLSLLAKMERMATTKGSLK